MIARVFGVVLLAVASVLVSSGSADACGKRAPVHSYWTPCHCDPCWPVGPVYVVSPPAVPLRGPDKPVLRVVKFGKGVIVEVTDPTGLKNAPTGVIQVIKVGGEAELKYEGYNKRLVSPGTPGAPAVYSVFLLPTKPGKIDVKVGFVMSDNTIENVSLSFDIVH